MFKPILFNTEMVKAIIEGRKTQTRRIAKQLCGLDPRVDGLLPEKFKFWVSPLTSVVYWEDLERQVTVDGKLVLTPCWRNDILWVRETWCENKNPNSQNFGGYEYRADYEGALCQELITWCPPIHMPKQAARIFLRVKDVRVELLRSVFFTDSAAILEVQKEGVDIGETCRACIEHYGCPCCIDADDDTECVELDNPRYVFSKLWDSTIKPADLPRHGWIANPWVWVIEFERIKKPEDWK